MKAAIEFGLAKDRVRKGLFPVKRVMALYKEKAKTFEEDDVSLESPSFEVFDQKGIACARCGIEGQYFAKERAANQNLGKYFFTLYAIDNRGQEVRMTRDHITPKSKGGEDSLSNYQTMCERCNCRKKDCAKAPKLNLQEKSAVPQTDPKELEASWRKRSEQKKMAAWMEGYAALIADKIEDAAIAEEIRDDIARWEEMKAEAKEFVEEKARDLAEAAQGMAAQEVAKAAQALIPNPVIRKMAVRLCLRPDEECRDMLWREAAYALSKGE